MAFEAFREEAEELTKSLMMFIEANEIQPIKSRVELDDVWDHVRRFRLSLSVARYWRHRYPCIFMEHDVPVPIDISWLAQGIINSPIWLSRVLLRPRFFFDGKRLTYFSVPDTITYFRSGLVKFLSGRLGNDKTDRSVNAPCGTGVDLTIQTRTHGLEIESTPNHFITWTYFGSPTSPVGRCIAPSYYYFRAVEWNPKANAYITRYQTQTARYIGGNAAQTEVLPV